MDKVSGVWQITVYLESAAQSIKAVESGFGSVMKTRTQSSLPEKYNEMAPLSCVPSKYKIDVSPFLEKPFLYKNFVWSSTQPRFQAIPNASPLLPYGVVASILPLNNVLRVGGMFRTRFCVNLSLTGTIGHQGMLLAAVIPSNNSAINPDLYMPGFMNTLMSSPHAFLSANEASSVCIEVPFYVNTDLAFVQTATGSEATTPDLAQTGMAYSQLIIVVLNPLVPAAGASTELTVVAEVVFKELELYVPHPSPVTWVTQSGQVTDSSEPQLALQNSDSREDESTDTSYTSEGENSCKELAKELCCEALDVGSKVLFCGRALCCCFDFVSESQFLEGAVTRTADSMTVGAKRVTGDFIDALRKTFRYYTGLHNPNNAVLNKKEIMSLRNYANQVDSGTCIEKLDPYSDSDRITKGPIFHTNEDEMLMASILSKPQYLGTFSVSAADTSGKLLWSRPISPWQGGCSGGVRIANNIEALYWMTRAWKGDMELVIQSVMTPKHSLKLQVAKYYVPSRLALTSFPSMASVTNSLVEVLEFSQGNQTLVIDLPYLARNEILYNTRDLKANALQHGMLYVYLLQPLVATDSVSTTVEFNVYMRCKENFSFYGYSVNPVYVNPGFNNLIPRGAVKDPIKYTDIPKELAQQRTLKGPVKPQVTAPTIKVEDTSDNTSDDSSKPKADKVVDVTPKTDKTAKETDKKKKPKPKSEIISDDSLSPRIRRQISIDEDSFIAESAEVMNVPSDQTPLLSSNPDQEDLKPDRLIPLVDVRPLVRRFQFSQYYTYQQTSGSSDALVIPVGDLIDTWRDPFDARGSRMVCSRMFYGYNGGIKYKLKIFGASSSAVRYIPPNIAYNPAVNAYVKTQPDVSQSGFWLERSLEGACPTVMTELSTFSHNGGPLGTICQFEGVIPHNTIYNFLGSMEWVRDEGNDNTSLSPQNNLGHLYVDFNLTTGAKVEVVAYAAFTDETRFGFQVFAPVLDLPYTTVSGDKFYITAEEIPSGTPTGAPTALSADAPAWAYYSSLLTPFS